MARRPSYSSFAWNFFPHSQTTLIDIDQLRFPPWVIHVTTHGSVLRRPNNDPANSLAGQPTDTTSGGEQRGRDNAKNVDGRKRHIVVDSMGFLLAVLVTAASVDDARAATELFARLDGQPVGKVVRMYADSKYHNFKLYV